MIYMIYEQYIIKSIIQIVIVEFMVLKMILTFHVYHNSRVLYYYYLLWINNIQQNVTIENRNRWHFTKVLTIL